MLPSDWNMVPLEALALKGATGIADGPFGSAVKEADYQLSGVPVLRGGNLSLGDCRLRLNDLVFISDELADKHARAVARANDVVFTKKGTIGSVGIIPADTGFPRFFISSNQMKATIDPSVADPLFVYYVFAAAPTRERLVRESSVTGVPKINLAYLRSFRVPAPPLPEQRRIASVLGALDDKIELNRKMNRTLEEMAQAIFKSWFIDFDGHDDLVDSEIGPVPRGWEVGPIDEIIEVIGGGTPKRSQPRFWGGPVPWFSVQDAPSLSDVFVLDTKEHITEAGLAGSSARLVPAGTTIISARGTVGKLAVADQPMAFNQSCYGIAPSRGYTHEFVYFLLRSVVAHLQRSAHGSVFDTITRATFQTAMVVQPPVERTRAFANTAGPLLKRIAANGRDSSTLTDLRDTLLPKLISGELRVPEAEAAVSEVT